MSKPRRRELCRQSVFSVRITNDVDDGFLKWLNHLNGSDLLARTALEALYMAYSNQMVVPGRWVPTPTEQMSQLPRGILGYLNNVPSAKSDDQPEFSVQPVVEDSRNDNTTEALAATTQLQKGGNEVLVAAMKFLDDDDF